MEELVVLKVQVGWRCCCYGQNGFRDFDVHMRCVSPSLFLLLLVHTSADRFRANEGDVL